MNQLVKAAVSFASICLITWLVILLVGVLMSVVSFGLTVAFVTVPFVAGVAVYREFKKRS